MKILNAFSLSMLGVLPAYISVTEANAEAAAQMLKNGVESCVGHADTAALFSQILGVEVPANRVNVTLQEGESALVGQYSGPRLPEGCTELPSGAAIRWLVVRLV